MNTVIRIAVNDEHAKGVCRVGCGKECCRYLTMSPLGWSCEKHSSLRPLLDARVEMGTMNAQGDNCEGRLSK